MLVKNIVDEDFTNYCLPSMFIGFPTCSFKCEKECGKKMCQNSNLVTSPSIEVTLDNVVKRYMSNPITRSIVFGGLEPFDSWEDAFLLIREFRKYTDDTVVIYTGYTKDEIEDKIQELKSVKNIVVKFGRFVPDQEKHYDSILGVFLASDNQYAERIS